MKRAQVTLFVVLGIVVVISIGLFLYIKGGIQKKEIAPGVSMIVEELPSEFMPLKPFVEKCLESTAKKSLIAIGECGGYAQTEKLNPQENPTEGDSVRFSENSDLIVPYWFYLSSPNSCTGECLFTSKRLKLKKTTGEDSVESQLSKSVEEKLSECIDNFKSIKELGFDVAIEGKPKVIATVAEDNIVIQLEYPLTISRGEAEMQINNFYTALNLDFKNIYEMADYITELETEYKFLEKDAINLIVGFSGKDKKKLPPMSDSSFEIANKLRWKKSEVKSSVNMILVQYIPLLRMQDTLNWVEIDNGNLYTDGIYNYGMALPNNVSINDVSVSFNYFDFWPMYFDLNCNGEVCEPESAFTDLLPIGMQRYNFAYDASFPVLVEIEDPKAFNNEGYSFKFMLEANIRNNKPMPTAFKPLRATEPEKTMLCDENKRTSGTVTINAVDSLSGSDIDGAEVFYTCIDSCYIGEVKAGKLETKLPVCLGGVLSLRKEEYETKYIEYDTSSGKPSVLDITLNQKKKMKAYVMKKSLVKENGGWIFSSATQLLSEGEVATVSVNKYADDTESNYDIIEFKNNSEQEIALSEGMYQININLMSDKPYYIPPQTKTIEGQEFHIQELNMSSFVTGMTSLNYTFTKEDVSKGRITFYVLSADVYAIPVSERTMDDVSPIGNFDKYTKENYIELVPRLE